MQVFRKCRTSLNNCHILEKILLASSTFIFLILFFDCLFQNLPLSGYGVIFCTIFIIGCSSLSFYHEIQKIISRNPQDNNEPQSRVEEWCWLQVQKKEKIIFDKLFNIEISSFEYPTNLNEQMRLLLKDIERDYVKPWYAEISVNPSFLFDSHLVLEEVMLKIVTKLMSANWKHVIKSILFVYLNHLQEYKRSLRRCKSYDLKNSSEPKKNLNVGDVYRYCHPGSLSEQGLNHYLSTIMEILLREYAPHDFVISLENSILTSILARKMLKNLLFNVEDPAWIYIRLLYLFNTERYLEIMSGKTYIIKEVTLPCSVDENNSKFKIKPVLLSRNSNLSGNIFDRTLGSKVFNVANSGQKKDLLTLQLPTAKPEPNISSVLSSLISSTAAPLLPDNVSLNYQPLNKMWLSPVTELKQEITDLTDTVVNPFFKTIAEGFKVDEKKSSTLKEKFLLSRKGLTRSKSSDSMSIGDDINPPLSRRDVSVGEELCENVFEDNSRRLVKTHSFDAGSSDELIEGKAKGDVSPVYEEPEDFATTIAKLRCVLQQRESTSTLSDKSNPSIESQGTFSKENTFDSGDKVVPTSPDGLHDIACDIPSDGRPFVNVCIPRTEIHDSSNTCYVLYTIQYDGIYVKESEGDSQLVLQATVVKRRFQEFLNLQTRLEENPNLRQHLKGIKGPSKWSSLPFTAKTDDATTANRRPILEGYLQQLCSKLELATSPALQEFLAYGSNAVTAFSSKDSNSSIQKIDKFLSNKVTGVFNSIKTVLPSFEGVSTSSSTPPIIDGKECKANSEQNILQGFLNFGNKPEDFPAISVAYVVQDATGEALTDDIRFLLSEKSDCIEDALDVLDSSDWLTEEGQCHAVSTTGCAWRDFKDAVIDDDLDKFDMDFPVFNLLLDILCELLDTTDGWITKEPIVHLLKVMLQHSEKELENRLSQLDYDRICGNLVRLLRVAIFTSTSSLEPVELIAEQVQADLFTAILGIFQGSVGQIVGMRSLEKAVKLFVDSLAHVRCNRDGLLRFFDIVLSQLLSCPHLTTKII